MSQIANQIYDNNASNGDLPVYTGKFLGLLRNGAIGQILTSNGPGEKPTWENNTSGYITSVSDTTTIDLDVTSNALSANVNYQNTSTINLSEDASGLKADLSSSVTDLLPTTDEKAALTGANAPDAFNVFATIADLAGGLPTGAIPSDYQSTDTPTIYNSGSWTDIAGTTGSITITGSSCYVAAWASLNVSQSGGGSNVTDAQVRIVIDGVSGSGIQFDLGDNDFQAGSTNFRTPTPLAVGTYTVKLQVIKNVGTRDLYIDSAKLFVVALQAPKGDAGSDADVTNANVLSAIGYTPENVANKTSTITGNTTSTTLYSTIKGIVDWVKSGFVGVLPAKSTALVDNDLILIGDSEDGSKTKTRLWSGIKSTLQTLFDARYQQVSVAFSANVVVNNTGTSGAVRFFSFSANAVSATEAPREITVPIAIKVKYFYLNMTTSQPASGSHVITLRKNQTDTAITFTIAAGSGAGVFSDTTNSVSYAQGDTICIKAVNNATANSGQIGGVSLGSII